LTTPNNVGSIQFADIIIDHTRGVFPLGIEYDSANYPTVAAFDDADNFDRANGALGSGWVEQKTGILISTNRAASSNYDTVLPMAYRVGSFSSRQYAEAVIDAVSNGQIVGVGVRCSGVDASASGIIYRAQAGINQYIKNITGGASTNMQLVSFTAWGIGDTVRIIADGNFIGVFRKPAGSSDYTLLQYDWLNGTHATGNPALVVGMAASWASAGAARDWAGGNIVD